MDLQQLCAVLQACMSPEQGQRTTAEQVLKQHESAKGQSVNLLRVAAEDSVDVAIRQSAAISFKNLVRRHWETSDSAAGSFQLADDDKHLVRENLLESLIRAPHIVQTQLGEVLKTIVYSDYPEKWPSLLPSLVANLSAPDPLRVHGALYALRLVTRKYELTDESERGPLHDLVEKTFPTLLHIFQQLLAAPALTPEVCTYTKLVLKCFWSATYVDIPPLLLKPEVCAGWMGALMTCMQQDLPESQMPAHAEDRISMPWWKSRKWLLHLTYRMFSHFSKPSSVRRKAAQEFAVMWMRECSLRFLDAHMALMARLASGRYFSPRCVNLLFQYMDHAVETKETYKHGAAHWDELLHNVAFPIMCFSDEDAALFEEDPHEYIRKGYDILEDMYNPKTAVANYAHSLCKKKKSHLDRFMGTVVSILQQYTAAAANGARPEPALARRMDGALLAIGVMSDILKAKSPYKQQLGPMLCTTVVPCFTSPYGHIRAKAAWVAGTYCDTNGILNSPTFNMLFEKVMHLLGDPALPVKVDAVVAVRSFISEAEDIDSLKPILPQLLTSVFQLMGEIDSEDLVYSLEILVQKFGEDIAPFAAQMVVQLVAAFNKYAAQTEEDDEDAEDMASIAAYGCLRAINTLMESVAGLGAQLYPAFEEALLPMLQKYISSDGQDIIEELLEILSYLTYYNTTITPRIWSLWPQLHKVVMEWGIDYWENLLIPLDNIISKDTPTFVNSSEPDYKASVLQMVSHSLSGDYSDREVVCAARLLDVVMQTCRGMVDGYISPYVALCLSRLPRTEARVLKDALVVVIADALYYNAPLALKALADAGALTTFFTTWFSMIMAQRPGGAKLQHFRRMQDKKICALGLLSLLSLPEDSLPAEVRASGHLLLAGLLRLLTALKEQQAEAERLAKEAEEEEEEEEEDEGDGADLEDVDDDEAVDVEDLEDDAYLKKLQKSAEALFGEGNDSDDEWTEDDEEQTPLDNVDPFIGLADTLNSMGAVAPARHAALVAACQQDAAMGAALQQLLQHAEHQRQELAKAQAAG